METMGLCDVNSNTPGRYSIKFTGISFCAVDGKDCANE